MFKKTLLILGLGQLYGHHSINQIMSACARSSSSWWHKMKKLSFGAIERGINALLVGALKEELLRLGHQSDSTWSRSEVTMVIDGSIFRQWLKEGDDSGHWGKYFSGQFGCGVPGFRVVLCGMVIKGIFYPFCLKLGAKNQQESAIACGLFKQAHGHLAAWESKYDLNFPNLYLSVDNGFESLELYQCCEALRPKLCIHPIFVPRKNDSVMFNGSSVRIEEMMAHFEVLEAEYLKTRTDADKKSEAKPFTCCVKVWCKKIDAEVVILFFRLAKSKKVSVIYTTDLNIKVKTLRRRWFQRTQIEQFFRLIKDTLKIQQSKSSDKEGFEQKIFYFVFIALQCQKFRNYCRKSCRAIREWGLVRIREFIISHAIGVDDFKQAVEGVLTHFAAKNKHKSLKYKKLEQI